MLKAEIDKKTNELVIRLPFSETGAPSASGKTKVHASTRGNQATTIEVNGQPLTIGVNAYTKA